ncbi:MAG: DUF116 domain-containing protein [bacterium]|nr:DUF116 domain-containing protein [bacterium]
MKPETKLPQPPEIADRQLGDEWLDWNGKSAPTKIETGKGLFILFSILSLLLLCLVLIIFHWLIQPRLTQFGPVVVQLGTILIYLLVIITFIWLVVLLLALTTRSLFILKLIRKPSYLGALLPWSARLGKWLGVSRDRISNSFLKVHNLLTDALRKPVNNTQLLILLPRCLNRNIMQQLRALKEKYQIEMFTAGGGDVAREMIRKKRPKTIIAIACERDLVSGIRDVAPYIPVLGFPNQRPEGPCKNTEVDITQVETAIRATLGLDNH